MARRPKPWFRKSRQAWFVTIDGVQHNLGPDKPEAYDLFYQLMRQPTHKRVSPHSLVAIIDEFLDWVQRHRSPESYEAYRYRLQRFAERYPDLVARSTRAPSRREMGRLVRHQADHPQKLPAGGETLHEVGEAAGIHRRRIRSKTSRFLRPRARRSSSRPEEFERLLTYRS